jgi:hypothetical protein
METIWWISLIALWGIVLLNLLLTLRVVRWLRAIEEQRAQFVAREQLPELVVGSPAPDFRARKLSGEFVRLTTYAGRSVLFLFVSPHCGACRGKIPYLLKLGAQAKERADVEFVLVSDSSSAETYTWLDTLHTEDGIEIDISILAAPNNTSDFLRAYNPRGFLPYFCLIDAQGNVQARDSLERGEWPRLQREWGASLQQSPLFSRWHSRSQ